MRGEKKGKGKKKDFRTSIRIYRACVRRTSSGRKGLGPGKKGKVGKWERKGGEGKKGGLCAGAFL